MNLDRVCLLAVAVALGALGNVGTARANLINNGSFENTPLPTGAATNTAVNVGAGAQISGWTTATGSNPGGGTFGNYFAGTAHTNDTWIPTPAQSGNYFVQLDSGNGGAAAYTIGNSIYQSLNLTANTSYSLSFYFRSETGNTNNVLTTATAYVGLNSQGNVGVNGSSAANPTVAGSYQTIAAQTFTSPVKIDTAWNLATLNFTVTTAGSYRFTFLDGATSPTKTNGGIDSNVSLDNFDLEVVPGVVPEFAHWAVFAGFGLIVAGGDRLRRRLKLATVAA